MAQVIIKKRRLESQKKPLVVVAGTAVSKKAVERNLLKRRVKAVMQPILKSFKNNSFTVILQPGAKNLSYQELKREILTNIHD